MGFVFYDFETTGANPNYDQPLQFGAVVTDENLNIVDSINLRCRRQRFLVPAPGAMLVTGNTPDDLDKAPMHHYGMMRAIAAWLKQHQPASFVGYNSLKFDEPMLRQALYQSLQSPYLTTSGDNKRLDVLRLVHMAELYAPHAIKVPLVPGTNKKTRKLTDIAAANGIVFDEAGAHDALADVKATVAVAKLIKDNAPELWQRAMDISDKGGVSTFLQQHQTYIHTDIAFGKSYSIVGATITHNHNNATEFAIFDLTRDPEAYFSLSIEELIKAMEEYPRAIRCVNMNSIPMLMPADKAPFGANPAGISAATLAERAAKIAANSEFQQKVAFAMAARYPAQQSPYLEERIHDGFPNSADSKLMQEFHSANWPKRAKLADQFQDKRYMGIAKRIIYDNAPQFLSAKDRKAIDEWAGKRMLAKGDDKPWMTIDKALTELNSWRKRDSDGGLAEQLQQITDYIQKIRRMAEKLLGIQPPRQPRMAAPSHHPPSANQNQPPRYHLG